jgi:hypothetical protein
MNRRPLILFAIVVTAILLTTLIVLTVFSLQPKPKPVTPRPTGVGTPSPTPSVPPESQEEHAREASLAADTKQPFVKVLPKRTPYWSLTYGGKTGGLYLFVAHVFYARGQDPQQVIDKQRPYIEQFVKSIGQPDGTYTIQYATTAF